MDKALSTKQPALEMALGRATVAEILGVHPRTLARHRQAGNVAHTGLFADRLTKMQEVWNGLLKIYKPENAVIWLQSEVPALGTRRPVDVMREDGGIDRVLETVARMGWGIPS